MILCSAVTTHRGRIFKMGAGRSKLVRTVKKPIETWGKAEKILERKPVVAPRHPSTEDTLSKMENGMF